MGQEDQVLDRGFIGCELDGYSERCSPTKESDAVTNTHQAAPSPEVATEQGAVVLRSVLSHSPQAEQQRFTAAQQESSPKAEPRSLGSDSFLQLSAA